ncbi:putative kinetochore protein nuf2 [Claviceps sorghi]|nr:putative kinetochore protein nuf2 [Claviceps sorghi]
MLSLHHIANFISAQMLDLKENIENEIHAAHDEYLKMESHIKLYMTEMEQSLGQ